MHPMKQAVTYILASKPRGTLYVGVTSDIANRLVQHRIGDTQSFTSRYKVHRLVWLERHHSMGAAIQREKQLKPWRRAWKIELIEGLNPEWEDLADRLF